MSKALKIAIEANDSGAVRKALKTVKDLGRKLPKAEAPLIYACQCGADQAIGPLLEAGAPFPRGGYEGNHPYALAAEAGHAKVLTALAGRAIPEPVINHALFTAVLHGQELVVQTILAHCKPRISQRVLEVATWWKNGRIFKLLLEHGADVNVANDGKNNADQIGATALHLAAGAGHEGPIRLLAEHGADLNRKDALGRTPLMYLAAEMPRLDQESRARKKAARRVLRLAQKALREKIESQTRCYGDREPSDGIACARLLLNLGADAAGQDRFGNDALMYYEWEAEREQAALNKEFVGLLKKNGARGGGATTALFRAIKDDQIDAARRALASGANVNRNAPPPTSITPLIGVRSPAMARLLLDSGADPNQPSLNTTPLIAAARSGEMELVKLLLSAGADLHAIEPRALGSEYVANAYSAAETNQKRDVADFLKSLGAAKPVLKDWKPLPTGVGVWENFSEVIARGDVDRVAAVLANLIGGSVRRNAYGAQVLPGRRSYLVLRPRGMQWCNIFQIVPEPRWFETDRAFLKQIAGSAKLPVLLLEYSDAAGVASIERFEPDGASHKEEGWDFATLKEIVDELGKEAPSWMKERLADLARSPQELDSTEHLSKLAQQEKFAIAWGGLAAEPGRKLDLSFTNLPAEAFDGVAWVSTDGG